MHFASFNARGRTSFGIVVGDGVVDLRARLSRFSNLMEVFRGQALDQAKAKKAQDEAMLAGYQKDLARFKSLVKTGFDTQQNIDQQQAKVDTAAAAIAADVDGGTGAPGGGSLMSVDTDSPLSGAKAAT